MVGGPQLALPIGQEQHDEIRTYRIPLPFLPPSKNVYDGWPIQWKSSAKKKWTKALLEKFEQECLPKGALRIGMAASLVFPTNARRDTQNYSNCLWNWVPDALVRYGAIPDDTPQYVYEGQIKDRVRAEGRVRFRDVFAPPFVKVRLIGIFLAVLELVRNHGLGLEGGDTADDIWLVELPAVEVGSDPESAEGSA